MKCKFLAALSLAATIFYSCDDETTGIGQFVANEDIIPTSADAYDVTTRCTLAQVQPILASLQTSLSENSAPTSWCR